MRQCVKLRRGAQMFGKGLTVAAAVLFTSAAAHAAIIDFTVPGATTSGSILGVGWTLSSTDGPITFTPQDGSTCAVLNCSGDGAGISDDEVSSATTTSGEVLKLTFNAPIQVTGLYFLDLYTSDLDSTDREQARVGTDGTNFPLVFTASLSETPASDSGFLAATGIVPIVLGAGESIFFTAFSVPGFNDDLGVNDFALAGVVVEAIPIPPALFLFGTALVGTGFLARRRRTRAALRA